MSLSVYFGNDAPDFSGEHIQEKTQIHTHTHTHTHTLSLSLSLSLSLCLSVSLSVSLSACLSVSTCLCLSVSVSLSLSLCLSVCMSERMYVKLKFSVRITYTRISDIGKDNCLVCVCVCVCVCFVSACVYTNSNQFFLSYLPTHQMLRRAGPSVVSHVVKIHAKMAGINMHSAMSRWGLPVCCKNEGVRLCVRKKNERKKLKV